MRRYLFRKVIAFVATLFFVSLLVFVVIRVLPGDPAQVIMGTEGNPEVIARLRTSLGLDRPLVVQYVDWLARALRGDLGVSIQYDVPVGRLIVERLAPIQDGFRLETPIVPQVGKDDKRPIVSASQIVETHGAFRAVREIRRMSQLDAEFFGSPNELTKRGSFREAGHDVNLLRLREAL